MSSKELPQHIAIIMDGNRRWAKEKSLPSIMGHRAGVKSFKRIVEFCTKVGIKFLSVYAFSLENWRRSRNEVNILLRLFEYYSRKERENLHKNGVKFKVIGRIYELPEKLQEEFRKTEEVTGKNKKLRLNLCVNYGSRAEIIDAVKNIAKEVKGNGLDPDLINEEYFSKNLYTADVPDPDLLIRTSGELRISNFLLWQIAYAEFWFSRRYWPDFDEKEFLLAIRDYQERDRRFGGTTS
ncbi:MAG: isoprenyl transferase [Firmicutes bacterium]|nr:isoprenyl transferase [Bacillota bacterium]